MWFSIKLFSTNMQHKYNENRETVEKRSRVVRRLGTCRVSHHYHYQLARTWIFQGRLRDAKVKLRERLVKVDDTEPENEDGGRTF